MPDIAGAMAAIEERLASNWTTTRIAYPNKIPDQPWPPVDPATGANAPWVLVEVANTSSAPRAAGQPGNQFWLYHGLIAVHVYVPVNDGLATARQYATAIGEIFRNATFYDDTPGYQVSTVAPRLDGGGPGDDDGVWYRVSVTIPFDYYHRG